MNPAGACFRSHTNMDHLGALAMSRQATARPRPSGAKSPSEATERIVISVGRLPTRKQVIAPVVSASANGGATQAIREHPAERAAVVDVEPFRSSDESTIVARLSKLAGLEEEMDVQARELACAEAKAIGCCSKPSFPFLTDIMMPNVGGIADEQCRAGNRRQCELSIISHVHGEAVGKPACSGVGTQHQRSERVHIDRNEFGVGKFVSGSDQKPSGARPWIDHSSRR